MVALFIINFLLRKEISDNFLFTSDNTIKTRNKGKSLKFCITLQKNSSYEVKNLQWTKKAFEVRKHSSYGWLSYEDFTVLFFLWHILRSKKMWYRKKKSKAMSNVPQIFIMYLGCTWISLKVVTWPLYVYIFKLNWIEIYINSNC